MLDYSQTWAPSDFYLPTFLSLPFLGLTSLLAQLHPESPCFICLHGSEMQPNAASIPQPPPTVCKRPDLESNYLPSTSRDSVPQELPCSH